MMIFPAQLWCFAWGETSSPSTKKDIEGKEGMRKTGQSVLDEFNRPFTMHGHNITISDSLAIVTSDGTNTIGSIMKTVGIALYEAK